jgi:protein ImuB
VGDDAVVFSIRGLRRLFGDPHEIASAISSSGARMGIAATLAIAASPASALLAARNLPGVTVILAGHDVDVLGSLPVDALEAEPELLTTLRRWGVATLSELAALPETGVRERLGEEGCRLRRLALGQEPRFLRIDPPAPEYATRQALDHPIELLEPLLFVISAQLRELIGRLEQNGGAAGRVTVNLELDGGGEFTRIIQLPFAMRDPRALLKQIQLSLEGDPPKASIVSVCLLVDAAEPRTIQGGLFLPAAPEPERLETLLVRLRGLVGENHVGSPDILETHRPDAYRIRPCAFEPSLPEAREQSLRPLRLSLRYFRPPIVARVHVRAGSPQRLESPRVSGLVLRAAGPWPTSGEWWATTAWNRREWDVALDDQGIYRIYQVSDRWFLDGSYD